MRLLGCALWAAAGWAHAEIVSEMDVRAAILLQLARYTEWPAAAFRSPQEPFQFCVVGDARLANVLTTAAGGRKIYNRPVAVRLVADTSQTSTCQVLFIRFGRERLVRDLLLAVRSSPVLTVGEAESFIAGGGILNLTWEEGSVRFEINQDGLRNSRLVLSSRLLRLARLYGSGGER